MHVAGGIVEELSATGEWVGDDGLADAWQARSTRGRDHAVTVTGPSLEAKEALAGDGIVDVAIPASSEEIAARWPDAQHGGMEIRALTHSGREGD
jgi:hypothetical protein